MGPVVRVLGLRYNKSTEIMCILIRFRTFNSTFPGRLALQPAPRTTQDVGDPSWRLRLYLYAGGGTWTQGERKIKPAKRFSQSCSILIQTFESCLPTIFVIADMVLSSIFSYRKMSP